MWLPRATTQSRPYIICVHLRLRLSMKTVAVIGTINPEIITGPIPGLPAWGTQVISPRTEVAYAGSAARVAFPLRALGHEVAVFGVIGNDRFGAACLAELAAWGIDASGVEQIEGQRTASCIAIVRQDAERMYISDTSILEKCDDAYLRRQQARLAGFDFVLLTGLFEIPGFTVSGVRRLFSAVRARGGKTLLDTGWHTGGGPSAGGGKEFYTLLPETDYILPNRDEIVQMTGTASQVSSPLAGPALSKAEGEEKGGGTHPHPPSRATKPCYDGRSSPAPPPSRGRELRNAAHLQQSNRDTDGGLAESMLRALRQKGAKDIYLKLGRHGAACLVGEEVLVVDPVPITPVNTTAAGECFNAGVLHGLAAGRPASEVLAFANRTAAHYVATGEYDFGNRSRQNPFTAEAQRAQRNP